MSNIHVNHTPPFLAVTVQIASFSAAQTSPKSAGPSLPCDVKEQIIEEDHRPIRFKSDEMKHRAIKKVDVGGILKNADVKATVIASVVVAKKWRSGVPNNHQSEAPADCK